MPKKAYLCASHFIKNVVNDAKKVLKLKKYISRMNDETIYKIRIMKTFIYSFTLLQTSTNIEEFDENIKNIYLIFNSEFKSEGIVEIILILRKQMSQRNDLIEIYEKYVETSISSDDFIFNNRETKSRIKELSPFELYYNNLFKSLGNNMTNAQAPEENNEFYFPQLFEVIKRRLYMMPLWSCVIVFREGPIGGFVDHITNNAAELNIKHTRNSLLG